MTTAQQRYFHIVQNEPVRPIVVHSPAPALAPVPRYGYSVPKPAEDYVVEARVQRVQVNRWGIASVIVGSAALATAVVAAALQVVLVSALPLVLLFAVVVPLTLGAGALSVAGFVFARRRTLSQRSSVTGLWLSVAAAAVSVVGFIAALVLSALA